MKNITDDKRIVLTLDAGGTNFIFSAIQGNKEIVEPVRYPSQAHDIKKCLQNIISGFETINENITGKADAISFAFPGPADYPAGIIGDLPNFKAFTGGVALGPMLEEKFGLPVFINNDGSLYAYGEALSGLLPNINKKILNAKGIKQFKNLIGITLGTGFGCGIVINNKLLIGDNSNDAGIHNTLNKFNPNWNAEESVSTRAIQRVYAQESDISFSPKLMPADISQIAKGLRKGNKKAAIESFRRFGEALGSSIANILTLVDGVVAIGGGITASYDLFAPAMFSEINRKYNDFQETQFNRLACEVYDLSDDTIFDEFAKGRIKEIPIPLSEKKIKYDEAQRTGIGFSNIGASKAIALGAYAFALQQLDNDPQK